MSNDANNTAKLVEAVLSIDTASLSHTELNAVRCLLLDHIGVVANGSTTDSAATFRTAAARIGGGYGADSAPSGFPVIGAPDTNLGTITATMANAVAGHSIEYDDVHSASSTHPGVVVFPAAMAATFLAGGGSAEFVRGVVVGYEVMCRAGRAADPAAHYARHFHPTGTVGALGAAAAAGAVMDLDVLKFSRALGVAATMACGGMEFLCDGAWTKRLHPALAARNGLEAALLAADGFIGTDDGVSGKRGFLAAYSEAPVPQRLLEGYGQWPLEVVSTSIKRHACCRYKQGPIDALLHIVGEHSVTPSDVESVVIGLPSVATEIVAEPVGAKRRPESVVDAQFSMPFGAAVALQYGQAGLDEYQPHRLADPGVQALMDRVDYRVDPEIDRTFPQQWRAWAEVKTFSGATHRRWVEAPKGEPENPFTPAELEHKFHELAACVYSESQRGSIAEAVGATGDTNSWPTLLEALKS